MGLLLKISISALFFLFAIVIMINPNTTLDYISYAYSDLKESISIFVSNNFLPEINASQIPLWTVYASGIFVLLGSIIVLIGNSIGIIIYAYIIFIAGFLLSIPYGSKIFRPCRRLVMLTLLFVCMFVLFLQCDSEELEKYKAKIRKEGEKQKSGKKDDENKSKNKRKEK